MTNWKKRTTSKNDRKPRKKKPEKKQEARAKEEKHNKNSTNTTAIETERTQIKNRKKAKGRNCTFKTATSQMNHKIRRTQK